MAIICPTITAENPHTYREQIERVQPFVKRLHIDLMDGVFTKNSSVGLNQVWWPEEKIVDIHLMFQNPEAVLSDLLRLKPNLVIVQAESDCEIPKFAAELNKSNIKCGIALLPQTTINEVAYTFAEVQHLLIFSGNLGYQGGSHADLSLLNKVARVKQLNSSLEVAWDGGINDQNIKQLVEAGIEVLDVGGYIHTSQDAQEAYNTLTAAIN